jgi:pimeloyl-ACP methyl ester carboxylesterase
MTFEKLIFACVFAAFSSPVWADCVLLVHGLARTSKSMWILSFALERQGYTTVLIDYPSTKGDIDSLAQRAFSTAFYQCSDTTHVVTHSIGGLLARIWLADQRPANLGRVVMLSPPNQGSEIIDAFGHYEWFQTLNGPAAQSLSTTGYVTHLPAVQFPLGVIAGSHSTNPLFSHLIPGSDDGKVSVTSTKLANMDDHITLPVTHTFMMTDPTVIKQTIHFLRNGVFQRDRD